MNLQADIDHIIAREDQWIAKLQAHIDSGNLPELVVADLQRQIVAAEEYKQAEIVKIRELHTRMQQVRSTHSTHVEILQARQWRETTPAISKTVFLDISPEYWTAADDSLMEQLIRLLDSPLLCQVAGRNLLSEIPELTLQGRGYTHIATLICQTTLDSTALVERIESSLQQLPPLLGRFSYTIV